MQFASILLGCVIAVLGFGGIHDQLVSRVSPEYFSLPASPFFQIAFAPVLTRAAPLLGAWWIGVPIAVALATAARYGERPRLRALFFLRPLLALLAAAAAVALLAGLIGYGVARVGNVRLWEPLFSELPAPQHERFFAALTCHLTSWASLALGGFALSVWTWQLRERLSEKFMR